MATIDERYDFIGEFHQGIAIVVKDGMYGAILMGGHEIITPCYDYISSFNDGYAQAIRKGECKILDLSGRECKKYKGELIAVPAKYDVVREFKDGYACVMVNGSWGVIDTECNEIFRPQFYYISDFVCGTAKYQSKKSSYANSWGYLNSEGDFSECDMMEPKIDTNGELIITRDVLSVDSHGNTYFNSSSNTSTQEVRINNKGQLLVYNGNEKVVLPKELHIAREFKYGLVCVQDSRGYWGAVNTKGEVVVPLDYMWIQDFSESRSFGMNKSGKLCLISSYGTIIKTFDEYSCAEPFKNRYAIVYKGINKGKQGLINLNGEEILQPLTGRIRYTERENRFTIVGGEFLNEKYGLFDASMKLLIMPKFKRIIEVLKDCVKVEIDEFGEGFVDFMGRAFIDGTSRVYLPDWCLGAKMLTNDIYLGVSNEKKCGLVNNEGETIYQPTFDSIGDIKDNVIVVISHNSKAVEGIFSKKKIEEKKYGLYNISSEVSLPAIYDVCPKLCKTYYKVSKGGLLGALDLNGNEILRAEWFDFSFENGYFVVCKKKGIDYSYPAKYGIFNKKGEQILEPLYDKVSILKEGLYKILDKRGWTLFNDEGQIFNEYFKDILSIEDGYINVLKEEGKGRIDLKGNKIVFSEDGEPLVLPEKFSIGNDFKDGIAKVWIKGYENYVDRSFKIVINNNGSPVTIETEVDYLIEKDNLENFIYVKGGLYGVVSKEGTIVIKAHYSYLSFLSNGLLIVSRANFEKDVVEYGLIDYNENIILDYNYLSIEAYGGKIPHRYWDGDYIKEKVVLPEVINYWIISKRGMNGLIDGLGKIVINPDYSDIQEFEHGFFVKQGGKWGVIDKKGIIISEPKYDTFTKKEDGFYKVSIINAFFDRKNESFGILDQFGREKLEPIYQFIGDVNDNRVIKGRAIINYRNRLGLVDENYNILAEPSFQHISSFVDGKATAIKYVEFVELMKIDLSTLEATHNNTPSTNQATSGNNKIGTKTVRGVIDVDGNFTETNEIPTDINTFVAKAGVIKIATLRNGYDVFQKIAHTPQDKYCAIIDSENNIILPFKYHEIHELENGMYKVCYRPTGYGGFYGLLDKDFKEIIKPEYNQIIPVQDAVIVSKTVTSGTGWQERAGLMNNKGKIILPIRYSDIGEAAPGLVWTYQNGNELVGLATTTGKVLIEPKYGSVESFDDNLAKVNSGKWYDDEEEIGRLTKHHRAFSEGDWGVINSKGIEIVPPIYESVVIDKKNKTFLVTKRISFVDDKGNDVNKIKKGRLNQRGILTIRNTKGAYILADNRFDWQEDYRGLTSVVYLNGKKGLINQKKELIVSYNGDEDTYIVLPNEYEWGYNSPTSYIVVEKGNKKGIIDKDGILIVDCIYDKIDILSEENSILFLCGKARINKFVQSYDWYILNKLGEMLWPSTFVEVKDLGNSLLSLKNSEGIISISNYDGLLTTNEQFDEVKEFGISSSSMGKYSWEHLTKVEGLRYAIVGLDGKYGVINKDGKLSIKPIYKELSIRNDNNFIADGTLINVYGQRISVKDGVTVIIPEGYDDAEVLQNGLILVKKGQRYGCINKIGTTIIPIEYVTLKCSGELLSATLCDDDSMEYKHGVINFLNRQIVPFSEKFSEIKINNNIILYKQESHWGAFSSQGEIICEPIYDHIVYISDNLIKVGMDDTEYSSYDDYYWQDGERYDFTNYDERSIIVWGLIDAKGSTILPIEYRAIADKAIDGMIEIVKNKRCGYVDVTGHIILEPTYKEIGRFNDGYAIVSKGVPYYDERGQEKEYSIYGVINSSFKVVIPCEFHSIKYEKEKGLFKTDVGYKTTDGKYIADFNGKIIYVDSKYKYCKEFHDDFAIAVLAYSDSDARYALINSKSEDILPPIFEGLELIVNGVYKFKLNGKYGLVDSKGNILLQNLYEGIGKFEDNLACISIIDTFNNYKLYGYIDSYGKEILPTVFEFIGKRHDKYSVIMSNGVWELFNVDNHNRTRIPKASYVGPLQNGLFKINIGGDYLEQGKVEGGSWGYINQNGEVVIEPIYEYAYNFSEGLAAVKQNGKYGFIDKDGNTIVPFEFDEVESSFEDGQAKLIKEDLVYVFNKAGEQIDSHMKSSDNDYYDYDDDGPSYSKYGGYNGWDDNTIDEAFDGNPELTWNID